MVERGLVCLRNLQHRGATGNEVNTGDGAGILIQMPDRFLRSSFDVELPPLGGYASGIAFLPAEPQRAAEAVLAVEKLADSEGPVSYTHLTLPTNTVTWGCGGAAGG